MAAYSLPMLIRMSARSSIGAHGLAGVARGERGADDDVLERLPGVVEDFARGAVPAVHGEELLVIDRETGQIHPYCLNNIV